MPKITLVVCGNPSQWRYLCSEKLSLKTELDWPRGVWAVKDLRGVQPENVQEIIFYGTWWGNEILTEDIFNDFKDKCSIRQVE